MSIFPMVLLSILSIAGMNTIKAQTFKIIYVGDPMCSWCYGFSKEITSLKNTFPDATFEMIAGGLRINGREKMSELKAFLHEHWMEVSEKTGAQFKFDILEADMYYNTEPACRALAVFKSFRPENALEYFTQLQKAFYLENHDPLDIENYVSIASRWDISTEVFREKMLSDEGNRLLQNDLKKARDIRARSFPSVFIEYNAQIHLISSGFSDAKSMENVIDSFIKDQKK